MITKNPLLQNLSSQVAFEAYARMRQEDVEKIHYDRAGFTQAFEQSALSLLASQSEAANEPTYQA